MSVLNIGLQLIYTIALIINGDKNHPTPKSRSRIKLLRFHKTRAVERQPKKGKVGKQRVDPLSKHPFPISPLPL